MRVPRLVSAIIGIGLLAASHLAASGDGSGSYSRWPKVRLAGISVGVGFSNLGGPPFGDPFLAGFGVGGFGWGGFGWGAYPPPAFFYPYSLGEVKLNTLDKTASVFLDGRFAGTASKLKDLWIEPGTHDLRVTDGNRSFEKRIYVLTGRTLKLNPALETEGKAKQ